MVIRWAFLFGFMIMTIAAVPALALYGEAPVENESSDQVNASVSGQTVVWQDFRNKSSGCPGAQNCSFADIYAKSPADETARRLTSEPNAQDPDIDGNYVVWRNWSTGKIIVHNLADSSYQNASQLGGIPGNTAQMVTPAISGNRIVWTDYRDSSMYGNIYMRDLNMATDEPVDLAPADPTIAVQKKDKRNPDIDGDIVVWQDWRNATQDINGWWTNPDIYMKDLSTGIVRPVCMNNSFQNDPVVYGDKIYWHDWRNGNWDIYMYDLSTNTESPVVTGVGDQSWPSASSDLLLWKDTRSGNEDIYLKVLSTGVVKPVIVDTYSQKLPVVSGTNFVWIDKRNGNWDIYQAAEDLAPPQVTSITPAGWLADTAATITAKYNDDGEGVDAASVVVSVDDSAISCSTVTATQADCPVTGLLQGPHTVSVDLSDLAGNEAATAATADFNVDTAAPDIASLNITSEPDTGTATIIATYSDLAPGIGVDPSSVVVSVDGSAISCSPVTASQASCTATGLTIAQHSVQVDVSDLLGNAATVTETFNAQDTRAPVISPLNITSAPDTGTATIIATYADPAPGIGVDPSSVVVSVDGSAISCSTVTASQASCTATGLTIAQHSVQVDVSDLLGNAATVTETFNAQDSVAPVIEPLAITSPPDTGTATIIATYSDPAPGIGVDPSSVVVSVDGSAISCSTVTASQASCTATGLTIGQHQVRIDVADQIGNASYLVESFAALDTIEPIISNPAPVGILSTASTTVAAQFSDASPGSGIDTDSVSVSVALDGSPVPVSGCNVSASGVDCSVTGLSDGVYLVDVGVSDNSGNAAVHNWSFSVNATGPVIDNRQPAPGSSVNNAWAMISADIADNGRGVDVSSIAVYLDGTDVTNKADVSGDHVAYELSPSLNPGLTGGSHQVRVVAADNEGTVSEENWSFTVVLPSLKLVALAIYWPSYDDYVDGQLAVDYQMDNDGTGTCRAGVVADGVATGGVIAWGPLPIPLGDIGAQAAVIYSYMYIVPPGVNRFTAFSYASCLDDGGNTYWFPSAPTF